MRKIENYAGFISKPGPYGARNFYRKVHRFLTQEKFLVYSVIDSHHFLFSTSTIFNRYVALKIEDERDKRYLEILLGLYSGINTSKQPMDIILEESILKKLSQNQSEIACGITQISN